MVDVMNRLDIFVATHPYLICNLLGLIPLSLLYFGLPKQRANIWMAGLIWVPLMPLAIFHEDYWNPVRLGNLRWGVEDALYLFNVTALAWAVTAGFVSLRFRLSVPKLIDWRRLAELISLGVPLTVIMFQLSLSGMTIQLIVNIVIALWLIIRCWSCWPLAVSGILLLPAIFLIELKFWLAIWPDFINAWYPTEPWGSLIAGIPLGEIAFYLTSAIAFPLSVAFCRGAVVLPKDRIEHTEEP